MTGPELSRTLIDKVLDLAGARSESWLCAVCGAVVADELLSGNRPPVHEHHGRSVELIGRAQP